MKILAIETSCDETAIAIVEAQGDIENLSLKARANVVLSQVELHKPYGGVYPSLAKREHSKNLVGVLDEALSQAKMKKKGSFTPEKEVELQKLLEREPELCRALREYAQKNAIPPLDYIAVTSEPGLEPALWVGINFAKALAFLWKKPLMPLNHMEGHIYGSLLRTREASNPKTQPTKKTQTKYECYTLGIVEFPALALLISGGHTELVIMKEHLSYEVVGETQDDAAGEAFDKVARILGLPYPGGPEISKHAELYDSKHSHNITFPRPMIDSGNYHFSFSGLKTAVKNKVRTFDTVTPPLINEVAYAFQEAASEVLVKKTLGALHAYSAKTLIIGGGVSANKRIREMLTREIAHEKGVSLFLPALPLTTDNALMIATTAVIYKTLGKALLFTPESFHKIRAHGTARLGEKA
ncbi:MAG: tRNA (adenosine(37)-N6)-threonylcarbamoyltransferase complex transferase subunit TsaD [Candidatus Paceibacterota bacterium]